MCAFSRCRDVEIKRMSVGLVMAKSRGGPSRGEEVSSMMALRSFKAATEYPPKDSRMNGMRRQ
jgi:hypothetical protein